MPPGHPSRYNKARHKIIVEAIKKGNYRNTAARLAGISTTALSNWLSWGETASENAVPYDDTQGRYRKLYEDVEEAEAIFEAKMVGRVVDAADDPKNWTAAMTILERTRPHKFGKRDTHVVEGGDKPIQTATLHIISTPEALEAANDMLKALTRGKELPSADVPALPEPEFVELEDE
jgi:hypothetical protein